ncbi:MAG: hypothetical protein AOA66_0985 [Candidatus Bathyarchaeota archaeon BA2]|nr:MAG: hypothetical protein AOA66_0985 [Candidatus Bathyarchaeota archaeon BA2]
MELLEALGQILTGLKHIGNGVTYLIAFALKGFGISASQELIKIATILILLSIVWKLGSKITSSIFWFFILAQFTSLVHAS